MILNIVKQFINNIKVKRSKSKYNNKEVFFGIQRYIAEHIRNLDQILLNLELANITVFREKSQFYKTKLKIIKYIYNNNSQLPEAAKILKIVK